MENTTTQRVVGKGGEQGDTISKELETGSEEPPVEVEEAKEEKTVEGKEDQETQQGGEKGELESEEEAKKKQKEEEELLKKQKQDEIEVEIQRKKNLEKFTKEVNLLNTQAQYIAEFDQKAKPQKIKNSVFTRKQGKEIVYFCTVKPTEEQNNQETSQTDPSEAQNTPETAQPETSLEASKTASENTKPPQASPKSFCVTIDSKTGKELTRTELKKSIFKDSEDFVYFHYGSALGADQNTVFFYYGRVLIEYRIAENEVIEHKTKEIELDGDIYSMQVDCLNEGFEDFLIVEMYTKAQSFNDALIFYKYFFREKKFEKFFEIGESEEPGFMHSYCKIDRGARYGGRDQLLVFKVVRKGETAVALVHFVGLERGQEGGVKVVEVELGMKKAYQRTGVFRPWLWSDGGLAVMQLLDDSVLVIQRGKEGTDDHLEVVEHQKGEDFYCFLGVFKKAEFEVGGLWSKENYGVVQLGGTGLVAVYSDLLHSSFRVDEFVGGVGDFRFVLRLMNASILGSDRYFLDSVVGGGKEVVEQKDQRGDAVIDEQ